MSDTLRGGPATAPVSGCDDGRDGDGPGTTHLHLDVLGGMAGDMFIAALLDARPDLVAGTVDAIRMAGLPDTWTVRPIPGKDGGLAGSRMEISPPPDYRPAHAHRHYHDIVAALTGPPLAEPVRDRALAIVRLIAEAEATVHGTGIDDVHLHEVGMLDSIADVVGAAYLIDRLAPASWSSGPLPVGGGHIESAHGRLPLPAPATQKLLEGFPFVDDGIAGERITPTGAAILRHLAPALQMPDGVLRSVATGHGFGTRSLPGVANLLRVRIYSAGAPAVTDTRVSVLEFMVDDQTPEELAVGVAALRTLPDVLDVLVIPAVGKQGRACQVIQLLARPEARERSIQACFEQTTTLGLRWRMENRSVLSRAEVPGRDGIAVKVAERPDGLRTGKAELADVAAQARSQGERERVRRQAEAAALGEDQHDS